jgi:hypothetical protein
MKHKDDRGFARPQNHRASCVETQGTADVGCFRTVITGQAASHTIRYLRMNLPDCHGVPDLIENEWPDGDPECRQRDLGDSVIAVAAHPLCSAQSARARPTEGRFF